MTEPKLPQEEEKLFLPDPEPEPIVVKVRALCGFLIGLFIAGATWLKMREMDQIWTILLFTVVPVGLAWCAAKWGDGFWTSLKDEF